MNQRKDKRSLFALRKHIDGLLAAGALITTRDPITIVSVGETMKVQHGMLISYTGLADLVKPATDHEWPDALRNMASELCIEQLEHAIEFLERSSCLASLDPETPNDDAITF